MDVLWGGIAIYLGYWCGNMLTNVQPDTCLEGHILPSKKKKTTLLPSIWKIFVRYPEDEMVASIILFFLLFAL